MKKLTFLITIILLASCSRHDPADTILGSAQACLEDRPEQALDILENIDKDILTGGKARARYALLYSIALDKNYIDVTTDSIIAPAVEYYSRHGNTDDKLKTHYYRGRIAMNAGNEEEAMEYFSRAEKHSTKSDDYLMSGRLYLAKSAIYSHIYANKNMQESCLKAADFFLKANDLPRYHNALINLISNYISLDNFNEAVKYLKICQESWTNLNEKQQSACYAGHIQILVRTCAESQVIANTLDSYQDNINEYYILWLTVANAYNHINRNDRAIYALDKYRISSSFNKDDLVYNQLMARIMEADENYIDALEYYKRYQTLSDNNDLMIFEKDTKFIGERVKRELADKKKNTYILVSMLCSIILILICIIIIKDITKKYKLNKLETKNTLQLLSNAQQEISHLNCLKSKKCFDKETTEIMRERFCIVSRYILETFGKAAEKKGSNSLRELVEKPEEFLESTRISFKALYPEFIKFLEQYLSSREIGYCCLICLGLNVSECNNFLNIKSYNLSYNIRKKLGMNEAALSLKNFLHKKFEELK